MDGRAKALLPCSIRARGADAAAAGETHTGGEKAEDSPALPLCLHLALLLRRLGCARVVLSVRRTQLQQMREALKTQANASTSPLPALPIDNDAVGPDAKETPQFFTSLCSLQSLPPGVEWLFDDESVGSIGPAAGLLAAHRAYPVESWLVIACDFPLLERPTLEALLQQHHAAFTRNEAVTCYQHEDDGAPEPLLAVWSAAALERLETNVAAGRTGPCYTVRQLLGLAHQKKKRKDGESRQPKRCQPDGGTAHQGSGSCKEHMTEPLPAVATAAAHLLPPLHERVLLNANTVQQWHEAVSIQCARLGLPPPAPLLPPPAELAPGVDSALPVKQKPEQPPSDKESCPRERAGEPVSSLSHGELMRKHSHEHHGREKHTAFAAGARATSFLEAQRLVRESAAAVRAQWRAAAPSQQLEGAIDDERVPLSDALGRVSSAEVRCPVSLPPFASSAMDGFVVRAQDTATASEHTPVMLRVMGCIAAGDAPPLVENRVSNGDAALGCCFEIMTGAPIPVAAAGLGPPSSAGAVGEEVHSAGRFVPSKNFDSCVRVEDVEMLYEEQAGSAKGDPSAASAALGRGEFVRDLRASHIRLRRPVSTGQHFRQAGEDMPTGSLLLRVGQTITPEHVLFLANAGISHVRVWRKVRVGILQTGSELLHGNMDEADRTAAANPPRARIPDSNGPYLRAMLQHSYGPAVEVTLLGCLPDDPERTRDGLRRSFQGALTSGAHGTGAAAAGLDLLLTSGGVSVGRYDLVSEAFRSVGGSVLFHGVAMKPGHPLLAGTWSPGTSPPLRTVAFFGLPGNPVAAGVCLRFFVAPWMRTLWGQDAEQATHARLNLADSASTLRAAPAGTTIFLKAQLCSSPSPASDTSKTDQKQQLAPQDIFAIASDDSPTCSQWVRPASSSLQQASRCAPLLLERFVWLQLTGAPTANRTEAAGGTGGCCSASSTGPSSSAAVGLPHGAVVAVWPAHDRG